MYNGIDYLLMFQRFIYFAFAISCSLAAFAASPVNEEDLTRHLNDSLPEQWTYTPEIQQEIPSSTDGWWRSFGDTTLDSLISLALDYNYDLAQTLRRTEIARNTMRQAQAGWYPSVGLTAGWSKDRQSGAIAVPGMPATVTSG